MDASVWHGRTAGRCAAVFAVLTAELLLQTGGAQVAAAREPAATGWWSTLGQEAATTTAPDVPVGGLLVQGGPTESAPAAFAALSYGSLEGTPARLALAVTGNSTPGAVLQACPLTESFSPAYGGAMADAPAFDCAAAVRATVSDDGTTQSFPAATLVRNGSLAIALLPTASTDRVVLAKPSAASLSFVTARPSTPRTLAAPPAEEAAVATATPSLPGSRLSSLALGRSVPPAASPATVLPELAVGPAPEQATPGQGEMTAAVGSLPSDDSGRGAAGLLAALMATVAVALWLVAGRSAERPLTPPTATAEVDR